MSKLFYHIAFILYLISSAGFIVFIITQRKKIFEIAFKIMIPAFVFHTFHIFFKFFKIGVIPALSFSSSFCLMSWIIVGIYILVHLRFRLMVLGSSLIPFSLLLMLIGISMPERVWEIRPVFKNIWLNLHIITSLLGNSFFAITVIVSIIYILQENQIKNKRFGSLYSRLPSLATLDSLNYYTIIYGFLFLSIGIITGAIYAQYILGTYWRWDAKETWSLITWIFYAALLHERLAVGWRGRRAAIMSIICFIVLIFSFIGVNLFLSSYHTFKYFQGRL